VLLAPPSSSLVTVIKYNVLKETTPLSLVFEPFCVNLKNILAEPVRLYPKTLAQSELAPSTSLASPTILLTIQVAKAAVDVVSELIYISNLWVKSPEKWFAPKSLYKYEVSSLSNSAQETLVDESTVILLFSSTSV
jgi:hypothetical protein